MSAEPTALSRVLPGASGCHAAVLCSSCDMQCCVWGTGGLSKQKDCSVPLKSDQPPLFLHLLTCLSSVALIELRPLTLPLLLSPLLWRKLPWQCQVLAAFVPTVPKEGPLAQEACC